MRVERTNSGAQTPTNEFPVNNFYLLIIPAKAEPQCQTTPVELGSPHEAICAEFFDICLLILHSY
jgi:hypothetical protein